MPVCLVQSGDGVKGNVKRAIAHIRNRAFTSIIPDQPRPGPHGANARDIDNAPAASLLQRWHNRRNAKIDALDIHGKHLVELVLGHVQRRLVLVARARVVDQDVQPAELGDCDIDDLGPVGCGCYVRGHGGDVCRGG